MLILHSAFSAAVKSPKMKQLRLLSWLNPQRQPPTDAKVAEAMPQLDMLSFIKISAS
jgi:hypothetical protein